MGEQSSASHQRVLGSNQVWGDTGWCWQAFPVGCVGFAHAQLETLNIPRCQCTFTFWVYKVFIDMPFHYWKQLCLTIQSNVDLSHKKTSIRPYLVYMSVLDTGNSQEQHIIYKCQISVNSFCNVTILVKNFTAQGGRQLCETDLPNGK